MTRHNNNPNQNKKHKKPAKVDLEKTQKNRSFLEKFFGSTLAISIFFVIVSLILYGNTIPHGYTVDDNYVTGANPTVQKGFEGIGEIFVTPYYDKGKKNSFEYRPIVKASYAIEYGFFGRNPNAAHFFNLIFYAFTLILIFFFLKRIMRDYNIIFPFLVTLLFAAHPIHTEVVNSLKNRDETLCFIGVLLATIFMIRYFDTNKIYNLFVGIFFFFFAFLSKAGALAFIALIPLTLYFFTKISPWKIVMIFFILFMVLFLIKYVPRFFLPPPFRDKEYYENPLMFIDNIWIHFGTGAWILLFYIKMLILPHPMCYYYGFDTVPITNFANFWSFLSVAIHLVLFIYALKKLKEKHIVSYGILFYLMTIAMYSNVIKKAMGIVADRFMYVPSLGFAIIIIFLLFTVFKIDFKGKKIPKFPIGLKIVLLAILIPYTLKTIARNNDWKDNLTLYERDSNANPKSFIATKGYANEIIRSLKRDDKIKDKEKLRDIAITYYNRSIDIYPDHPDPWRNLGKIYLQRKEYEKCIYHFKKAIEITPDKFSYNYYNVGLAFTKLNRNLEAIPYFEKALEIYPEDRGYISMANSQINLGNFEVAAQYADKALELNSLYSPAFFVKAFCAQQLGDLNSAISFYEKTLEINPSDRSALMYLSNIY